MQHFDINLAVGAVRHIDVSASYIYFLSGGADGAGVAISVKNESGGDEAILRPGQAFKLAPGKSFKRWVISNHSGESTIVGTVLLGDGDFYDNRISGSVEVVDGGKSRTMAGVAFLGWSLQFAAVAEHGMIQLFNPVASGKNLIVEQVVLQSDVSSGAYLADYGAALAVLKSGPRSKDMGGAASVAEIRTETGAAILGALVGLLLFSGGQNYEMRFAEPIVIRPGKGLLIASRNVNEDIQAWFEYYEEGI